MSIIPERPKRISYAKVGKAGRGAFYSTILLMHFKALYPVIGEDPVKTMPKGFPKDFAYPEYIKPRLYTVWHPLSDDFLFQPDAMDQLESMFRTMYPFNRFLNEVFDDYME